MSDLPLAAASARLGRRPGRPRKLPLSSVVAPPPASSNNLGITHARPRINTDDQKRTKAREAPARLVEGWRLLDVDGAAIYLGVSKWTIKDLIASGHLPRVRLPLSPSRDLRRLLIDVRDLDKLIESNKETLG